MTLAPSSRWIAKRADNLLRALATRCARLVLARCKPAIVGITGSVGKTTATEAIAAVLRHPANRGLFRAVGKTSDNMNNRPGLPLAILGYDGQPSTNTARLAALISVPFRTAWLLTVARYPDVLVLEFGTDRPGYMAPLVALARPDVAVVTTIGPAHLQALGSLAGVANEKGTLVRAVPPNGLVVLGDGHDFVEDLARMSTAPVVRVSGRGADLAAAAARAVARHLGVPDEVIETALREVPRPERRLDTLHLGRLSVIDDTFNANPLSMVLGLDTLAATASPGRRRVAVLGTMAELGPQSPKYHEEVGAYARTCADLVIGVGEAARSYSPDRWYADSQACADAIGGLVAPGDCLLVKGSASVEMRLVVERLKRDAARLV